MPDSPEIIDLVYEALSTAPVLAEVQEWSKANVISLASPGGAVGMEKEVFIPYDRELDEATAHLNIVLWAKNVDPVAGEAATRALAQAARQVLIENKNLSGAAAESYVYQITYATANGGGSLMLHLAELDYRVTYYAGRPSDDDEDAPAASSINMSLE